MLNEVWVKLFGTPNSDWVTSLAIHSDGSIFAVGRVTGELYAQSNAGYQDAFIVKLDKNGSPEWTQLIGGQYSDVFNSVAVSQDGSAFAVGEVGNNSGDVLIARFDVDGSLAWKKIISGTNNSFSTSKEKAVGVAVDDSFVYVAGITLSDNYDGISKSGWGSSDGFISKYSHNGEIQWTVNVDSGVVGYDERRINSDEQITSVALGTGGTIYVSGTTGGGCWMVNGHGMEVRQDL